MPNQEGITRPAPVCYNSGVLQLELGNILRLRKPHPCGGYEWRVVRLGADIGLRCQTCNRRVLLPRSEVERRTKSIVHSDATRPPDGTRDA